MANKVWIANCLVTRTCNLRCSYCSIIRDNATVPGYDDMPAEYPKMKYYSKNELGAQGWIDIFERLRKNNPDVFVIIYGGEPTVWRPLKELVKYCNDTKLQYTIISNATQIALRRAYQIAEEIGPFRGFTCSVDPVFLMKDREWDDIAEKSKQGFEHLTQLKESGMADDVVAEITIMKESIPYLYPLLEMLTEKGIYASITAVDDHKSPFYDFSNVGADVLLEQTDELRALFDRIIEGSRKGELLVHIPGLLDKLWTYLPSKMKCTIHKDLHNVSIEPDGSFRLCLRVKGVATSKIKMLDDIISEDGKFTQPLLDAIKYDYKNYCLSCNHTCMLMSDKFRNQIIDHDGKTYFKDKEIVS